MEFLSKLLQGISFLPAIISGIEGLFGGRSAAQKKDAAMSLVGAAVSMTDAVTNRQIIDEERFKQGLSKLIDGTGIV
jgi:NhaP-type Na+/H+ or K+/H+ antiporter